MTRKFSILVLVLGMASTAGAAVSLGGDIDGEIVVGTTGIVTVISDNTSPWTGGICFDPPVGIPELPISPFAGEDAGIIPPPLPPFAWLL